MIETAILALFYAPNTIPRAYVLWVFSRPVGQRYSWIRFDGLSEGQKASTSVLLSPTPASIDYVIWLASSTGFCSEQIQDEENLPTIFLEISVWLPWALNRYSSYSGRGYYCGWDEYRPQKQRRRCPLWSIYPVSLTPGTLSAVSSCS